MRYSELITESVAFKNSEITVHSNPNQTTLDNLLERSRNNILRGILGSSLWLWDAYYAVHEDIQFWFGVSGLEIECLPTHVLYDFDQRDFDEETDSKIIALDIKNNRNIVRAYGIPPSVIVRTFEPHGGFNNIVSTDKY